MRVGKFVAIAFASLALVAVEAEARRLGGGKSFGRQSSTVTERSATPAPAPQGQSAAPAQQVQPSAARPSPGAQPAQPARSRWMAPLAGLAAGLGLAALANYLGFGEGLASLMLVLLLAFAAIVVVRLILSRRAPARPALQTGYAASGVGTEATVRYSPLPEQDARSGAAMPTPVIQPAAVASSSSHTQVPADFDVEGFVRNAKVQFVRLQAAFDGGDLNDLREFTAPEMFAELKMQIDERKAAENRTDVVKLDAELLGIESGPVDHLASVRFTGLIRESEGAPAQPFDEVWNLTKPADGGSGWVLAGIQQLG